MRKILGFILLLAVSSIALRADWPRRVFAPYMYLGAKDKFELTQCDDACGQKFYTLAFVIAGSHDEAAWDGKWPTADGLYADQISAIRARGGDVIVSFGGEAGKELALVEKSADALAAKYQAVIDAYQFTWLDFDIEGKALDDAAANERRNAALAILQRKNPALIVSYTLPVNPEGISKAAQALLRDAKAKGVKVHSANIMTMDYGSRYSQGKKMSDVSIASALKTYEQCQPIDADLLVGLTPMIGQNDEKTEVFTPEDAQALRQFADDHAWVCSLSFWSSNRDTGQPGKKQGNTRSGIAQKPWEFTNCFKTFTAK